MTTMFIAYPHGNINHATAMTPMSSTPSNTEISRNVTNSLSVESSIGVPIRSCHNHGTDVGVLTGEIGEAIIAVGVGVMGDFVGVGVVVGLHPHNTITIRARMTRLMSTLPFYYWQVQLARCRTWARCWCPSWRRCRSWCRRQRWRGRGWHGESDDMIRQCWQRLLEVRSSPVTQCPRCHTHHIRVLRQF